MPPSITIVYLLEGDDRFRAERFCGPLRHQSANDLIWRYRDFFRFVKSYPNVDARIDVRTWVEQSIGKYHGITTGGS